LPTCAEYASSHLFKPRHGGEIQSAWWLPYCALLLGGASAWHERVETPWTRALRARLDAALPLEPTPPTGSAGKAVLM
jgi:hypothetical protein